jgi:sodium/potassium-transporting ATPase subunit alpha
VRFFTDGATSVHVDETREGREIPQKKKGDNIKDLADLDWHLLDVNELCNRLGVSKSTGLDAPMVKKRLERDGKNALTNPGASWRQAKKIFWAFFGGFGPWLLIASIICFVAW